MVRFRMEDGTLVLRCPGGMVLRGYGGVLAEPVMDALEDRGSGAWLEGQLAIDQRGGQAGAASHGPACPPGGEHAPEEAGPHRQRRFPESEPPEPGPIGIGSLVRKRLGPRQVRGWLRKRGLPTSLPAPAGDTRCSSVHKVRELGTQRRRAQADVVAQALAYRRI